MTLRFAQKILIFLLVVLLLIKQVWDTVQYLVQKIITILQHPITMAIPPTHNETITGCLTGSFDSNVTGMLFTNGTKTIPSLSYSEVGVINIKMEESVGSEFALVDASDTPNSDRLITPYDQIIVTILTIFHSSVHRSLMMEWFHLSSTDLNVSMILI